MLTASKAITTEIRARIPWAVFWALLGQGVFSISRFFSSMVVGGRFGVGSEAELGYYGIAFGVMLLIVGLHEAFVTTPMTFFLPKQKPKDLAQFTGRMLFGSGALIGIGFVVAIILLIAELILQTSSPGVFWTLVVMGLVIPFQILREFSRRWLLAQLRPRESALLDILFASLYCGLIIVSIWLGKVNAPIVFALIGTANLLSLIHCWRAYRSEFQLETKGLKQPLMANIRYGRWIAAENICSVLTMYFCHWFLYWNSGEIVTGVFTACMTVVFLANPFLLGVAGILLPKVAHQFSESGWKKVPALLLKYSTLIVSVLGSFAVVLFFLGDNLTNVFFGDKYSEFFEVNFQGENWVTFTLGVAMPFLGISYVASSGLLAANMPHLNFVGSLLGLLAVIISNFAFAEPTIMTAAMSFVIGAAVMALFRLVAVLVSYYRSQVSTQNAENAA